MEQVVIGVDPHKLSATIKVVDTPHSHRPSVLPSVELASTTS
jgi:hypothetical protein